MKYWQHALQNNLTCRYSPFYFQNIFTHYRSSPPQVFLGKYSPNLQENTFTEIALKHGYSPVNLLHVLRIPFYKDNYGGLLLVPRLQKIKHGQNAVVSLWSKRWMICYTTEFNIMETEYDQSATLLKSKAALKNSSITQVDVFCLVYCRGGSRTAATFKMERFVIIVNGWKLTPLTSFWCFYC